MSMNLPSLRLRFLAALVALPLLAAAPADTPASFPTPEAAVDALVAAARTTEPGAFVKLFGRHGVSVVSSGDRAADDAARARFVAEYEAKHALEGSGDSMTLAIGADDWPFPIPLHHGAAGWYFDVAAGEDEILNRRVGANELYVQQVMLAYVDAQYEYARSGHDGSKLRAYAQKLISAPGKHDGLWWPDAEDEPPSQLGGLVAEAQAAGYHPVQGSPEPFHGYFFHILTGQGPHAPGGAYDYVQKGAMIGGFGLVAWPAKWGNSGVMTFIVNQDGEVYEKNLGPEGAAIARAMTRFDPDESWTKLGAPAPVAGLAQAP